MHPLAHLGSLSLNLDPEIQIAHVHSPAVGVHAALDLSSQDDAEKVSVCRDCYLASTSYHPSSASLHLPEPSGQRPLQAVERTDKVMPI